MIRYLRSKVNLWDGMYFFSMMEDKMIYQAGCFDNIEKKGTGYFFKNEAYPPFFCPRVGKVPFLSEKVACPLF
jgi:hypothetical protein